jgi:glycosyltransferase involved in cell wall biosynthesis
VRPGVSACLIARDEAERLPACLDALSWVDEIIVVVDDRTRDATAEIAGQRGARVVVRRYEGDIAQKSFAVDLARNEWVLQVDPDEVVTAELAQEIQAALGSECAGYEINRITFHLGRWIRHGAFFPDWKTRLIRKSRARWEGVDPHGRIVVDGPVRRLHGYLQHFSYRDLSDQVDRVQLFSAMSARDLHSRGRRSGFSELCLRPPLRFLRDYFFKSGWRDGVPGLIIAAVSSFHVFLKYAKLWEMQLQSRTPLPDVVARPCLPGSQQ